MNTLDYQNILIKLDFSYGFAYEPTLVGGSFARLQRAPEGAGQSIRSRSYHIVENRGMRGMYVRVVLIVFGDFRVG